MLSGGIRQIAFMGRAMYTSPEFPAILDLLGHFQIEIFFNGVCEMPDDAINAIIKNGFVKKIYHADEMTDEVQSVIDKIEFVKKSANTNLPEIIITQRPADPSELSHLDPDAEFHGYFNFARDVDTMPCMKLVSFPLIDYDGIFIGCWDIRLRKEDVNVFNDGIEVAINSRPISRIIKMLRRCDPDHKTPCVGCPGFISLMFTEKKLDIIKGKFI